MPADRPHRIRRPATRAALLSAGLGLGVSIVAVTSPATVAAPHMRMALSCATVSIVTLNRALGIDAAHVTTVHPPKPAGSLVCSYYGASGRGANEATINYLPVSNALFGLIKAANARSHPVRSIPGIKQGAYSFVAGDETFLYVHDGPYQVQLYATRPLARLLALGRALPAL